MTKAEYARHVMLIQRRTTQELDNLTEGMWNPHFCSSEAKSYADAYLRDLEDHISRLRPTQKEAGDE